jgi:hypothetical protein
LIGDTGFAASRVKKRVHEFEVSDQSQTINLVASNSFAAIFFASTQADIVDVGQPIR